MGQSYPPPLELPDAVVATAPALCYRFHGVPHLYASSYAEDFLRCVATGVAAELGVAPAYLYFQQRHRRFGH